jgi:hypothetical protein
MASTPSVQPPVAEQAQAVRDQLARILANPLFKHSRHYPALLRYVVEQTLDGRASFVKERALGIEVFGRESDYDTNLDPVVRTSASEVRKRLAQYYHDEAHASELRIDLPLGSYVPEFRFVEPALVSAGLAIAAVDSDASSIAPPVRLWTPFRIGAIVAVLVLIGVAAADLRPHASPVDRFWGPVWGSSDTVMLCISAMFDPSAPPLTETPSYLDIMRQDRMAFADALTMARLSGLLEENHRKLDIRRSSDFNLADFRKGPAVLIGAYNNPWTMRLADQLRYTFQRDPGSKEGSIADRQNPSKPVWHHNPYQPYSQIFQDWAIVSRFVDSRTEQMVVVVAGMGKDGTAAAGEFVTDARYLQTLADRAPKGWERKNLQVVLKTEVINGNVGPPRIMATYFW